jgi:hypothetical protein
MKILKIEKGLGYFVAAEEWKPMDKLNKDDLLKLVDLVLTSDVEMDAYNEDQLQQQAHRIIYKNVLEKLGELQKRKAEFTDESDRMFHTEYEKYKIK